MLTLDLTNAPRWHDLAPGVRVQLRPLTTVLMVASGVGIHSPGEDPGSEAEALACVEVALELGGDPNAIDQTGETALHGAAYRGANSIVHLLVEHGANTFDVENEAGWTPLRIADGVHYTGTVKRADHTADLLRQVMKARGVYSAEHERDVNSVAGVKPAEPK